MADKVIDKQAEDEKVTGIFQQLKDQDRTEDLNKMADVDIASETKRAAAKDLQNAVIRQYDKRVK